MMIISVVIPVYNAERYLQRCISSVQSQTYSNWEMVITDDCSTDNGCEIVESYAAKDPRIKLFRLNENGGPGVARNNSIANSQGQYIAFLDSDDTWMPDKLEKQLALMADKGCGVVYSSYLICDGDDNVTGMVKCKARTRYWREVCDNSIGFLTMMFDRKIVGDAMLPTIRKRQDWGLNIELLRRCRVAYGVKKPLAVYRIRKGSVSRDKLPLVKYNISIYRQILGYSAVRAVLMFTFIFMPFYIGKKVLNFFKTICVNKHLKV